MFAVRIENFSISMSSEHSVLRSYTREESLRAWTGEERTGSDRWKSAAEQLTGVQMDMLELSDQAKAMASRGESLTGVARAGEPVTFEISEEDKQKILVIQKMLEALTGKRVRFYVLEKLKLDAGKTDLNKQSGQGGLLLQRGQGWGLEYDLHESCYEREKMSFTAQGIIKTADGREINISVQLSMSREFALRQDIRFRAGDAVEVDPLVIHFNGPVPELTSRKFSFDLDADGKEDQVSFAGPDSGLLALDLNGDGRINSGRELFGPNTGNGFSELAEYDEDGNQWIDENDSIYSRLRIWTKDSEGRDVLFALGQKGVGAIFLGNIKTLFDMKDQSNNLLGRVQESGVYLNENGSAGIIQHIDLTI